MILFDLGIDDCCRAGLAGAFIDREVETRGMNFIDREKAKRHAREQIDNFNPQNLGCDPNSYNY